MPAGRLSFAKFGRKRQKVYLDSLAEGSSKTTAAAATGVSYELIRLYRKEQPEFSELEEQAQLSATEKVEDALFQAASSGNVRACEVWLYNRCPDKWKDQRNIKVGGDGSGVPIPVQMQTVRILRPPEAKPLDAAGFLERQALNGQSENGNGHV